jgi:3-hydroxybutyryl-CoA dehydrogenase
MKNVTVIGAGTMGNGIAHVFAQTGFRVQLLDVNPTQLERAITTITKNLDRQVTKGTIDEAAKTSTLANITTSTDFSTGIGEADLVVEAASEHLETKLRLFHELDSMAP